MPKYLVRTSYTADGIKGLTKDGGTKRQAAVRHLIESLGGKLEALYWAFGETDLLFIVDLPDNATAAGASLAISGTGLITSEVTVLITPEEMDHAVSKHGAYVPPGR